LEVFERAGLLSDRFCAVHFTHPNDAEIQLLRSHGAQVVACPTTEMDLGDGFLPLEKLRGVPLSIGSDSHVRIDPLAELRSLEWHARARLGRRCVLVQSEAPEALAAALVQIGSRGGAHALGLNTGELVVGRQADFIAVDTSPIPLATGPLLSNWIFSGQPGWVKEAWVGGEQVLFDGKHPREHAIRQAAVRVLETL
jgi:formimidoylglutamate deiminase